MTTKALQRQLTAAEFERLSDHQGYELIDGRLRRKAMGVEASDIQSELNFLLRLWARETQLGRVYDSECMYQCFPGRSAQVRKPDVSFIRADRLPGGRSPAVGMFDIRPDLVIEVVSPGERADRLNEKVQDFLGVGTPLIWVIYPASRTAMVYEGGHISGRTAADDLVGDPILPGFTVRVADLFPPPPAAQA